MYGWGISQRILQLGDRALEVSQGSLHPVLQRLEKDGFVASAIPAWRATRVDPAVAMRRR